jgi:transcription antitermination factor NusG
MSVAWLSPVSGWHLWELQGPQMESWVALASNSALSSWLPLAQQERWYVARTLAQRELHAARQLTNQGFRVFVPRYWKNRRHARRVETISAPLFPRYIFVILDRTRDRWRSVNGTLGVERLLMQAGEPQPVPQGVVEGLITAADAEGNVHFDFHLKEGQTIRVTAGPLADLVGQLEGLDDNGRVRVLLEIMGGKVRVALPQTLVAPTQDVA